MHKTCQSNACEVQQPSLSAARTFRLTDQSASFPGARTLVDEPSFSRSDSPTSRLALCSIARLATWIIGNERSKRGRGHRKSRVSSPNRSSCSSSHNKSRSFQVSFVNAIHLRFADRTLKYLSELFRMVFPPPDFEKKKLGRKNSSLLWGLRHGGPRTAASNAHPSFARASGSSTFPLWTFRRIKNASDPAILESPCRCHGTL